MDVSVLCYYYIKYYPSQCFISYSIFCCYQFSPCCNYSVSIFAILFAKAIQTSERFEDMSQYKLSYFFNPLPHNIHLFPISLSNRFCFASSVLPILWIASSKPSALPNNSDNISFCEYTPCHVSCA